MQAISPEFLRRNRPYSRLHWSAFGRRLLVLFAVLWLANATTARFLVVGHSMEATIGADELVVVNRLDYLWGQPQRGDIVVFNDPRDPKRDLIKRVVGLPGEIVEMRAQEIYIDGIQFPEQYLSERCNSTSCVDGIWQLGPSEYFLLGDNRNHSQDSRFFGPIHADEFVGRAVLRYWPLAAFEWLE